MIIEQALVILASLGNVAGRSSKDEAAYKEARRIIDLEREKIVAAWWAA